MLSDPSPRWHAVLTRPNYEIKAQSEIGQRRGFEAYLPTVQRQLTARAGGGFTTVARFMGWVFARFDHRVDVWEDLGRRPFHDQQSGILRVVCDAKGWPIPIPERAMEAMRAYVPEAPVIKRGRPLFKEGMSVNRYLAGRPQGALFIEYTKRGAKVKLWMLGSERIIEVAASSLEEIEHG